MSMADEYSRMKAALTNIMENSQDDFARHQAAWGLGYKEKEVPADGRQKQD